jgi:putative ABC transport system ATP-binding protein
LTELEQEDVEAPRPIEKIVSLKSISKEYSANGKKIKALDDINLDVKPKELVVLLGPSGAGKTTILNLIAGLEKPTSGDVRVLDIDLVDSDENFLSAFRAASIGFIFQSYNLVSTLTARENVELMMELAGWSDANRNEKRTAELIESVGLTERADHLPAQLSGGEQQRVAIARALANDPQLILADEPTGNLDMKTGSEIVTLLEGLKKERDKTVIITTHDERIVQKADVIYRVERGRLVGEKRRS